MSTARARAQSRSTCLAIEPRSGVLLKRHLEVDVWPERVPDRTVLVARQRDGALDRASRYEALDDEMKADAQEPVRRGLRSIALEVRQDVIS